MNDKAPTFEELIWPTIKALRSMGGSANIGELVDKIIELESYPEEVQKIPHTQRDTKIEYNAAWARTYLKKVGALNNSSRGVWSLTEYGERLTEKEAVEVPQEVRKQEAIKRKIASGHDIDEIAELFPEIEFPEAETQAVTTKNDWKTELLEILQSIHPDAFERLCQRFLRESGFTKVEVTGKVGDGGIDGVGVLRVNLLSFQVLFQCKRWKGSVGSQEIRNFRGAMQGRSDKGLFITTGTFTADARKEATRDGAPAIDLIDGEMLCEYLKNLKLGLSVEIQTIEKIVIDSNWYKQI